MTSQRNYYVTIKSDITKTFHFTSFILTLTNDVFYFLFFNIDRKCTCFRFCCFLCLQQLINPDNNKFCFKNKTTIYQDNNIAANTGHNISFEKCLLQRYNFKRTPGLCKPEPNFRRLV